MILYMYIAPGQGLTTLWWRNFDVNRNISSLRSFDASFKKISLKSDFIHAYSPGAGTDSPQGQTLNVNRNVLSLHSFVASLKQKCLWSLILYISFHDLIHGNSLRTKFWCQLKDLITLPISCKLQRNLFKVWVYTLFFHDLIHVYSPGAGETVLMSTETYCHFGHLLLVSIHRLQYFLKNPLFYLFPVQKQTGQNLTLP